MLAARVIRRLSARVPVRSMSAAAPSWGSLLEPKPKVPRHFVGAFPEESAANNFEVNWSLADDDITPRHKVHRNRAVHELAQAAAGAPVAGVRAAKADELDAGVFFGLWEQVTEAIGFTEDLYISDGAIGGHAAVRTPIRVVSDSPAVAHALANLLVKVPTLKDPHTPRPILVVYDTKTKAEPAFVYNIDTNEDGFTQAKVIVRGAVQLNDLLSTVLSIKAQLDGESSEAAVVAADVVVENGATSLVFQSNSSFRGQNQAHLGAAHGAIWHPSVGVTPAFQGAVLPPATVQAKKAKTARHQTFPAAWDKENTVVSLSLATAVNHPTTAVAFGAANKDVSVSEFVQLVGGSPALAAALEQHKTKCVVKKSA